MIAMMMIGTKTISTTTISSSKTGTRAFNNTRFGRASNDTFSRGSLKKKGEQRKTSVEAKGCLGGADGRRRAAAAARE